MKTKLTMPELHTAQMQLRVRAGQIFDMAEKENLPLWKEKAARLIDIADKLERLHDTMARIDAETLARIEHLEIQCDGIGEDNCAELVELRAKLSAVNI